MIGSQIDGTADAPNLAETELLAPHFARPNKPTAQSARPTETPPREKPARSGLAAFPKTVTDIAMVVKELSLWRKRGSRHKESEPQKGQHRAYEGGRVVLPLLPGGEGRGEEAVSLTCRSFIGRFWPGEHEKSKRPYFDS